MLDRIICQQGVVIPILNPYSHIINDNVMHSITLTASGFTEYHLHEQVLFKMQLAYVLCNSSQVHNSQHHILHVKVIIVIFISCNVLHMPCQIYLSSSIYAFNMYCREHERTKNTNMLNASKIGVSYLLRATRTSFVRSVPVICIFHGK